MKVYEREDGRLEKIPENAKQINVLKIVGNDGKTRYADKFEMVTIFGKKRIFTQGKEGKIFEQDPIRTKIVNVYAFTVSPKNGKPAYTKYVDANSVFTMNRQR